MQLLGVTALLSVVDVTPLIGSPQFDLVGLVTSWPFSAFIAERWIIGLQAGCVAALSSLAWGSSRAPVASEGEPKRAWISWFVVVWLISVAELAISWREGILTRFANAALEGLVVAIVVLTLRFAASRLLYGLASRHDNDVAKRIRGLVRFASAWFVLAAAVLCVDGAVMAAAGAEVLRAMGRMIPNALLMTAMMAALIAVMPDHLRPRTDTGQRGSIPG